MVGKIINNNNHSNPVSTSLSACPAFRFLFRARALELNLLKHIPSVQVASCSRRVTLALSVFAQGLTLRLHTVRV